MVLAPFVILALPVADMADPPPRPTPPTPMGASKAEVRSGVGLVTDDGIEIDLHATGTGYMVAWSKNRFERMGTVWTGATVTYYTPADSEMMADRYWIGPMIRGSIGTEIFGRYGLKPGALQRMDADLGYRFDMDHSITGAIAIGLGVVHDDVSKSWTQGLRLSVEFTLR
jgi:hypothetical protein